MLYICVYVYIYKYIHMYSIWDIYISQLITWRSGNGMGELKTTFLNGKISHWLLVTTLNLNRSLCRLRRASPVAGALKSWPCPSTAAAKGELAPVSWAQENSPLQQGRKGAWESWFRPFLATTASWVQENWPCWVALFCFFDSLGAHYPASK